MPDISYHIAYALHALGRDEQARHELEVLLKGEKEFWDRPAAEDLLRRLSKKERTEATGSAFDVRKIHGPGYSVEIRNTEE